MSAPTPAQPVASPVGEPLPRDRAKRLLAGRGRYVDDLVLPRMLHVAFVRSPYPHARIAGIDAAAARALPGVARIVTGAELREVGRAGGEGGVTPKGVAGQKLSKINILLSYRDGIFFP